MWASQKPRWTLDGQALVGPDGHARSLRAGRAPAVGTKGTISEGVAFSTLEAATFTGTNGSGEFDEEAGPFGNIPAILTVNAGSTGNSASVIDETISGEFLDDGGQFIIVCERVSGMNTGNRIQIIFSSNGKASKTATVTYDMNLAHGDLIFFRVYPGSNDFTFAGSESFANTMNYMEIRVDSTGGTAGGVLKVHGVWRYQRQRTAVCIGVDDGLVSQYRTAFQYMTQRGLTGYMAVSEDYVDGNYMSIEQMQEMYDAGWDLVVHGSKNHNDASLTTPALLTAEIRRNRDFLLENGWTRGANCYVYPGGVINSTLGSKAILTSLGFRAARLVTTGTSPSHQVMTSRWGIDDPLAMPARDLSGAYSAASDLSLVDRAIDNGSSAIFYGHAFVRASPGADQMTYAEFKTFIDGVADRARDGKVDVLGMAQFADRYV